MNPRRTMGVLAVLPLLVAACAGGNGSVPSASIEPSMAGTAAASGTPSPIPSASVSDTSCQGTGGFEALPVNAACWIDIATGDGTPVRVRYAIPAPGWSAFIGTFKDVGEGQDLQRVNVLIADVKNVTVDACDDQTAAEPPIGPGVEELAAALAKLPPFEVISPPADTTAYGYSATHLRIRVPVDQPFDADTGRFVGCSGSVLASWIAPPLSFAFYGYAAPGDTEDFWILDVDGTRIAIVALATANASDELLAQREAILDSIVIEP